MSARSALLAQVRASASAATALSAVLQTEITLIVVANTTAGAVNFRLFHDDDGTTYDQSTALYYDVSLGANSTLLIGASSDGAGITLSPGGALGVYSATDLAHTFSIYGSTQSRA